MSNTHDTLQGKLIVGIDLGTTNSGVAVWDENRGRGIMLGDGNNSKLTPSMVGWDPPRRDWVVGYAAKTLGEERPGYVAYSIKRYIGRWFTDSVVFSSRQALTYRLESGGGTDQLRDIVVNFRADDGTPLRLTAPEISAKVLLKLREN